MSDKTLKYAKIERERRFLFHELPPGIDLASDYRVLEDLYLPGTSLRVRCSRSPTGQVVERKLNQKLELSPPRPTHRITTSVYLGPVEYELLTSLGGCRLVKRRYPFLWKGARFGVDVFQDVLEGLILAEAEASSDQELESISPPGGLHLEVTEDPRFSGAALAAEEPARILEHAQELIDSERHNR